ncbi:MAG: PEP-CTERM-box response regulator transcription factor, partial [Deltaproteobacteria bacterium]|nr:PEP-CTERM-box response regulator transcription factor [Deltaproteobacteria bacterium]
MEKAKLLIVEDNSSIATQMKWALAQEYEVFLAEDRVSALKLFKEERPPVVTLDLGLPPHPGGVEEGFQTLSAIIERDSFTKVILITGQDEKENALKAIGKGAYDFFCKPVQIEELKIVLQRAYYLFQLEEEHRELQRRLTTPSFEGMLGTSPQMQTVFSSIQKVATTEAPVLITGESGTGKELVARAIHRLSQREKGPFIVINCGAIPETLLESELFGHEKGAFTGAHIQRKGRFEKASGGTLFLDEIGDLPLPLQVKLLRFLQEQKIERVGGREEISVDARVLTATNKDLKQELKTGKFREDLYYRIGIITIFLPPLREREGDILLLASAFLQKYSFENRKKIAGFTPHAIRAIETYGWPGNIRELENRIKRAVIMAENSKITPQDLELDSIYTKYQGKGLKEAREELEKEFIQKALAENKGNITQAAGELGISRPTLYELMEK